MIERLIESFWAAVEFLLTGLSWGLAAFVVYLAVVIILMFFCFICWSIGSLAVWVKEKLEEMK